MSHLKTPIVVIAVVALLILAACSRGARHPGARCCTHCRTCSNRSARHDKHPPQPQPPLSWGLRWCRIRRRKSPGTSPS